MSTPHTPPTLDVEQVRRLRHLQHAVRATLALGVAASVTANVLHAESTAVGRAIAAWPPLALLLTIELISRVPITRRALAATRVAATTVIASIAAWVSYWHMVSVAARYGEASSSAHLIPISVDGLVVVASICLVEISAHLRTTATAPTAFVGGPANAAAFTGEGDQAPDVEPIAADTSPVEAAPAVSRPRRARPAGAVTAATVRRLRRAHPGWTVAQIAQRAGVTERTVRRHLAADAASPTQTATPTPAVAPAAPAAVAPAADRVEVAA